MKQNRFIFKILALVLLLIGTMSQSKAQLFQSGCPGVAISGKAHGLGDTAVHCGDCVVLKAYAQATAPTASDYTMQSIPYNPPFSFTAGTELTGFTDDYYIAIQNLPFDFCFYDSIYSRVSVGSNGIISFDRTNAGNYCPYSFYSNCPIPNANFNSQSMNAVYGVYEDIYPWYMSDSSYGRIFSGVLGEYPCRKACFSYFHCALFGNYTVKNTSQIVLYEGTNVIDIYIKEHCIGGTYSSTNNGEALVGIQNANGTKGMAPTNRNGGQWTTRSEAWRFTPIGSSSYTITWYEGRGINGRFLGSEIVNSDTAIARKLVCPTEPTWYTVELQYTACNGSTFDIIDSVFIDADTVIRTFDTICTNEPYMFGDQMRYRTGVYYDTIRRVNVTTCDSVVNCLDLRFGTTHTDTARACDRYVWQNGRTYTRSTETPTWVLTNSVGCDSTITLHLTMDYTSKDTIWDTVCEGQYSYMFGVPYTRTGTYIDTVTTTVNSCDSIKVLNLVVVPKPSVVVHNAGYDCETQTFKLISQSDYDNDFHWYSSPYDLSMEGHEQDSIINISPRVNTYYSAVVSNGDEVLQCYDTASIFVEYSPKLVAQIYANPAVVHTEKEQIKLTDISLGNVVERWWTMKDVDRTDTTKVTYYNFPRKQDSTWVNLVVRNQYNCYDSTTTIIPIQRETFWIPNAFTPNLATNKTFEIKGLGIIEYKITIYDRDGLVVYTSNTLSESWDGVSPKGKACKDGVYTYVIHYKGVIDPSKTYTQQGSVLLVR